MPRLSLACSLGNTREEKWAVLILNSNPNVYGSVEQMDVVYLAPQFLGKSVFTVLSNISRILKGLVSLSQQGQEGSVGACVGL